MYEAILTPTDGSNVAENAIDHAMDIALKYDAKVHALYVVDLSAMDIAVGTEQIDRFRQGDLSDLPELERRARNAISKVADRASGQGIEVTEAIVAGTPHKQIANYAEDNDIDLVVMGSHGRSGVKRALLGSVTERTLRSTHVPVLVVDARKK